MENDININLLKKIISIPSLSQDHKQCLLSLTIIKKEIESHNIPCSIGNNNDFPFLIAGDIDLANILFLSHTDIVPGDVGQFKITVKENQLFGRGVLDMKGPLIASLDSFLRLWGEGRKQFLFAITSDEEIGGFNGSKTLTKTLFRNIKQAIIPDSTGDSLILIQKAPFHIKIDCIGKSCHGSKPWEGVNAADNLLECCKSIVKAVNRNSPNLTSACISQFHSGDATNKVPDNGTATLDIRIKEESEVSNLIKIINASAKKYGCSWEKIDEPMFFETKIDEPFVQRWINTFEKVVGKKLETKVECGASDARFLWHELRIPIIVTSAIGGGAHSNNEWVDIISLNLLSEIIFKFGLSVTEINSL